MGRPSKLTLATRRKILSALGAGSHLVTAAAAAGVTDEIVREWILRGKKEAVGIYHDFFLAVSTTVGGAELKYVKRFAKGALKDPALSKEFLARRWPQRWGTKVNGGTEGPPGPIVPIQIIFRTLPPGYDPVEAEKAAALAAEARDAIDVTPIQGVSVEGLVEPAIPERRAQ